MSTPILAFLIWVGVWAVYCLVFWLHNRRSERRDLSRQATAGKRVNGIRNQPIIMSDYKKRNKH